MRNLSTCPICDYHLNDSLLVCPQCGNSEIEDIDIIDVEESEKYRKRLEEKQALWSRMLGERQRLAGALETERTRRTGLQSSLQAIRKEAAKLDEQVKQEREKHKDLQKQVDQLVKETL